jgi:hypothetical protein
MRTAVETKSDFHSTMAAMQAHYHGGQGGDFFAAQPQFQSLIATNALAGDDAHPTPEILRAVIEKLASQQRAVADAARTSLNDAVNSLKANKDVDDFRTKVMAQRDKAQADSDANIDSVFDKAVQLAVDHPEMQSAISIGMNAVLNVISGFDNLLEEIVRKLASQVEYILKDSMNPVEGHLNDFTGGVEGLLGDLL